MSRFYITPNETDISFTKINEVLSNNISSSVSSAVQPNSKISNLSDKSYKYLFSQNITSLTKQPIKFSDFRNNVFFAADVSVKPETPSAYADANDGQIVITPFGGTGEAFNVQLAQNDATETYIDGYTTGARTKPYGCAYPNRDCKNHPWSYPKIPIYKTRIGEVTVAETECLAGNSLTKIVDTGDYHVRIEQIDATGELSVIRSYDYVVSVGWRGTGWFSNLGDGLPYYHLR